jgi:hypothetical protein
MAYIFIDPSCAYDGALGMIPKENTAEEPSSVTLQSTSLSSGLSLPVLAAHRLKETDKYRRGEPFAGRYGLQLLHRAMIQDDQEAWGLGATLLRRDGS